MQKRLLYPLKHFSLHSKMYLFLLESRRAYGYGYVFTFQNVSISTIKRMNNSGRGFYFTFQNVSISTRIPGEGILHHTAFTFQNVSISTGKATRKPRLCSFLYIPKCIYFYTHGYITGSQAATSLHSKMYLFLQGDRKISINVEHTLHSKMYLFLPEITSSQLGGALSFTFQNVSISTY